jgi:trehalose 6-phosphate phosphatase
MEAIGVAHAAFLLDFDGTLVDIAPAPDQVRVARGLVEDITRLRDRCGGALAIVSGRPVAQIETFLPGAAHAISGEHGTAIRRAPRAAIEWLSLPPTPASWRAAAQTILRAHPGVVLEDKHYGFVLHYRAAPDAGDPIRSALEHLLRDPANGYKLAPAKMAWELRPDGTDKGAAVQALMAQAPFAGRIPIFVGDDATDEDGMREARALGGIGLRVGEAFADAAAVRAWIARLAAGQESAWPA